MSYTIPMEVEASRIFGFNLGIKFVRGAYMMEERQLAEQDGTVSPIWDSIEETHKCYNDNVEYAIKHMTNQDLVFVASHNTKTVELATTLVEDYGFKDSERVRFGQLRGFSDQITSGLSERGFKVYKYVPFGPTE